MLEPGDPDLVDNFPAVFGRPFHESLWHGQTRVGHVPVVSVFRVARLDEASVARQFHRSGKNKKTSADWAYFYVKFESKSTF